MFWLNHLLFLTSLYYFYLLFFMNKSGQMCSRLHRFCSQKCRNLKILENTLTLWAISRSNYLLVLNKSWFSKLNLNRFWCIILVSKTINLFCLIKNSLIKSSYSIQIYSFRNQDYTPESVQIYFGESRFVQNQQVIWPWYGSENHCIF